MDLCFIDLDCSPFIGKDTSAILHGETGFERYGARLIVLANRKHFCYLIEYMSFVLRLQNNMQSLLYSFNMCNASAYIKEVK